MRDAPQPDRDVGFFVNSLDAAHAELANAGFAPAEAQGLTRGGVTTTTFYCNAPDDVLIEVAAS